MKIQKKIELQFLRPRENVTPIKLKWKTIFLSPEINLLFSDIGNNPMRTQCRKNTCFFIICDINVTGTGPAVYKFSLVIRLTS